MMTRLLYRCEVCGEIFAGDLIHNSDNAGRAVLSLSAAIAQEKETARTEMHACKSGNKIGIGKLIGISYGTLKIGG